MGKPQNITRMLVTALRHRPELLNLAPDKAGYCPVSAVLKGLRHKGISMTEEELCEAAKSNPRLGFDKTGGKIRADYGSSLGLRLSDQHEKAVPPKILYHGTSTDALDNIHAMGVMRMGGKGKKIRDHVFLTDSPAIALKKGARHGSSAVLIILAEEMAAAGYEFYHAKDDIWLTDYIPAKFIDFSATIYGENQNEL